MEDKVMARVEKAVAKIIALDASDSVKALKLWKLAAKQIPHSKAQAYVQQFWSEYYDKSH